MTKSDMSSLVSDLTNGSRTAQNFSRRIKERRSKLGMDQLGLAQKTGIGHSTIQRYEAGNIPKGDYLLLLSQALDCSVDWLLKGSEPPRQSLETSSPAVSQQPAENVPAAISEDFKLSDMITKTVEVLESDTIYRTALASNINAFHQAVRNDRILAEMERRVAQLEEKIDAMSRRMEDLEKENQELKRRMEPLGQKQEVGAAG